jgi:4-alpha-glucanotransferase
VSRDSADVWSRQDRFKLDLAAGAPPDACFAAGQKWGMPPYDWARIASEGYSYVIERLRYAENFYDLFRIDHFVGLFRLWSFPLAGGEGFFDPADESVWEDHGRRILTTIVANTSMLPCAEDLGTVPDCSYKLLREFSVPGMDVQRWSKNWDTGEFRDPRDYRLNSMATVSTHDLTSLAAWWEFEAGTVDEVVFRRKCEAHGIAYASARASLFDEERSRHGRLRWKSEVADGRLLPGLLGKAEHQVGDFLEMHRQTFDEKEKFWAFLGLKGAPPEKSGPAFVAAALEKANASASVFTSQLLQDWLSLGRDLEGEDVWNFRINFPGTMSDANWTLTMPVSLERMGSLAINKKILAINEKTGRAGKAR